MVFRLRKPSHFIRNELGQQAPLRERRMSELRTCQMYFVTYKRVIIIIKLNAFAFGFLNKGTFQHIQRF